MPTGANTYTKPFLRWAGGKSWLIKHIDKIIGNQSFNNYHEPFLGGGSIYFYLSPKNAAYLSDLNNELIITYTAIKESPDDVISQLRQYHNTPEDYYAIRQSNPITPCEVAARFIFLNQTSFNGIYRVNARGEYNVPYGNRTKEFLEEDKLRAASLQLQNSTLSQGDFECIKPNIQTGDLVFLDPPYTVSHNNNGFIKYNQRLFSLEDQYRLRQLIDFIKSQGAYYILTNAAHQTIGDIFTQEDDIRYEFSRASLIGGENATRGKIKEYIFTNIKGGRAGMSFVEGLVTDKELIGVKKRRSQPYIFAKFENELREKRESEGWLLDKELKNSIRMKHPKPIDEQFEDEVWCLFANLGFTHMNRDRHFVINYGTEGTPTTKQIDVFAADEETILFVECKCAVSGKKADFKTELEAIKGIKEGLFKTVRKHKDFRGKKVKYIFATKNYEIIEADKKRMTELGIYHFDEYGIKYFSELAKHLGTCARFQLLGTLFAGQKIGSMENRIPAIEGKMGGYTYYSFSIEPEKLLKIAYVLHRNEANSDMMPTYQRIIKKARLKEIRSFVDKGGFFPNSLIISIDTNGKKLQFDQATPQVESSLSKIGILHLPQLYRSAYIIDGQHRLYGYAGSKYASTNSIPVVAFVNLEKDKQVELFMEINENQKTVSKNLQNTLNADLLWSSEDKNKQRKALRLNIAQKLGELQSSPFFGRIVIGETEGTQHCCLTIDTIESALKSTHFLTRFGKDNAEIEAGTFDRGTNIATRDVLLPFLVDVFQHFKNELPDEWEQGDANNGILTINNTIHALIRTINDIIDHLVITSKINPKISSSAKLVEEVEPYLAPIITYLGNISESQRKEIRTNYGSGGKSKVWRMFEQIIHESIPNFSPEGLAEWIRDNTKQFNAESFGLIQDIEYFIKDDFAQKLQKKYQGKWLTAGMPPKVYKQANTAKGKADYENSKNGIVKDVSIWDCVTIANCKDIAVFGSNWTELFESDYTRPEELKISGGKNAKTAWITKFAAISNNRNASYSFSEEEYLFLKSIHSWLIDKKVPA